MVGDSRESGQSAGRVSYAVLVSTRAAKDLGNLATARQRRIFVAIDSLVIDPRPVGSQAITGLADTYRIHIANGWFT